jgi:hypothetical protein
MAPSFLVHFDFGDAVNGTKGVYVSFHFFLSRPNDVIG